MQDGDIKYAMMPPNDAGGIIDDFIVYRWRIKRLLASLSAGSRDKGRRVGRGHRCSDDVDYVTEDGWTDRCGRDILKKLCANSIPRVLHTIDNVPALSLSDRTIHSFPRQATPANTALKIPTKARDTVDLGTTFARGRGVRSADSARATRCGSGVRQTEEGLNTKSRPKMAGLPCKLTSKDFIGRDALVARRAAREQRTSAAWRSSDAASCGLTDSADGKREAQLDVLRHLRAVYRLRRRWALCDRGYRISNIIQ